MRAGESVTVEIRLDTEPREVEVPADLAVALDAEWAARVTFSALSSSKQSWHVPQATGTKTQETRERHIAKSMVILAEGRKR